MSPKRSSSPSSRGLRRSPVEVRPRRRHSRNASSGSSSTSGARVDRHRPLDRLGDRPQIVDAVAMIGVGVRPRSPRRAGSRRPSSNCWRRSGPQSTSMRSPCAFDQDRGAQAAVARFGWDRTGPSRCRSSARPVDVPQPRMRTFTARLALVNRRKKFGRGCVGELLRLLAAQLRDEAAVSATKAGSHFWPRCGTGARNGESVSTSSWSAGSHFAVSCRSAAFLKVTMPDSET